MWVFLMATNLNVFQRCHDFQENDSRHNDTRLNDEMHCDAKSNDAQHCDAQYDRQITTLITTLMLNRMPVFNYNTERHYPKWHLSQYHCLECCYYAECSDTLSTVPRHSTQRHSAESHDFMECLSLFIVSCHSLHITMSNILMLIVILLYNIQLIAILLNVIMQNVILLNVCLLNTILLIVIMLNVILMIIIFKYLIELSVILQNVLAPYEVKPLS